VEFFAVFAMGWGGRGRGDAGAAKRGVQKAIIKQPRDNAAQAFESELLDPDYNIDESQRFQGKVDYFDKRRGFGFLVPDAENLVPENKVMVHWKEITSSDRWPFLTAGLEIEFQIKKVPVKQGKRCILRAVAVTRPGGEEVALQDEVDEQREYVGGKEARYMGTVKWYHTLQGYGYITLDDAQEGTNEVKVNREEVSGGQAIPLHQGLLVEFGLIKNKKGTLIAYHVTLPGGEELTRESGEARVLAVGQFSGEIDWYDYRGSQGWIVPDNFELLPADIQESVTEQAQRRADKTGKETLETLYFRRTDMLDPSEKLQKGTKVTFEVYQSHFGAGACSVKTT